jgi:hypothetical protein
MTTPSGQISLNDVNVELGFAGTTLIQMNQDNVRTLAGVGGSGTVISMQNLQGKSNRVTASVTLSSDTTNYVLNTAKASGYVAGKTDMTLTINSGVTVYSTSTGSYALQVDTSWTTGDTVTIVNNGTILGCGGNGGSGGTYSAGSPGSAAGPALLVQRALTMNNLNRIAGGGGGGGGGGFYNYPSGPKISEAYGGGGGGGGVGAGAGGPRGTGATPGTAGGGGSLSGAGSGGAGAPGPEGFGGPGGSFGSSGTPGDATPNAGAGSGGAAGVCISGNSNITYTNTGTRNGSIS